MQERITRRHRRVLTRVAVGVAALLVLCVGWIGVSYFVDSPWLPVTSGTDGNGVRWWAYISHNGASNQGTLVSIAPQGEAGTDKQFVTGGPFWDICKGPCEESDLNGLSERPRFGLVPSNAVAVVVAPGVTVKPAQLPRSIWISIPDAKLYVFVPANDATQFTPYPIDSKGHRLPLFHE